MKKFVCYYRVSTDKQGSSGLGLEAQKQAVYNYINASGEIISEFTEIESGKKNNRTMLNDALKLCKATKATLIIAKLDRLSRNVHFISGLLESGVDFIAVDNPHANKLMLHLLAAFAEHEREAISSRTKSALQAAKQKGVKLGEHAAKLSAENHNKAKQFAADMIDVIAEIKNKGFTTLEQITLQLNKMNVRTFHNKGKWHIPTTSKLLKKINQMQEFGVA
jgi:DNA invertase Pin-like site-specific DNA recombinase